MTDLVLSAVHWVIAPFRWLRKAWLMLRELRTHEQRIQSARDLLARELRQNAALIGRYEQGELAGLGSLQEGFKFDRWHRDATEWSALRRSNRALWDEVADAYEAISAVKTLGSGAEVPPSGEIRELADRVAEAEI
jgi:hypothetical protein